MNNQLSIYNKNANRSSQIAPRLKHVIFDWAGTLYDDHYQGYLTTKQVIKELSGRSITFAEYKKDFCLPVLPFYRQYGVNLTLAIINERFFEQFKKNFDKGKIYDGVHQTLKLLKKQKISASIFSTMDQALLETLCQKLKIKKYFTHIHGSVCDKRKELKAHLKQIRKKTETVLFIGDTDHDIDAANKYGLWSGCVFNGYQGKERLLKCRPLFVWNNQNEWIPFFKSLNNSYPKKTTSKMPMATSGALVFNEQKEALFVLTHKWSHTYGISGGKINKGETAEQACIREIFEETGLKIKIKDLVMVQDCINPVEFYQKGQHFLLFNYTATTRSKTVKLNSEALSYVWLKPEEALNVRLNEPTRMLLNTQMTSTK